MAKKKKKAIKRAEFVMFEVWYTQEKVFTTRIMASSMEHAQGLALGMAENQALGHDLREQVDQSQDVFAIHPVRATKFDKKSLEAIEWERVGRGYSHDKDGWIESKDMDRQ